MMYRIIGLSLFATVAFTGCASSGRGEDTAPPPAPTETRIAAQGTGATGGVSEMTANGTPNVGVVMMKASVDQVWQALIDVYAELGIPTTTLDEPSRTIGNAQLKVRRRLGTVPLTKYIDCGSTQGGLSAETYEVVLSIYSQIQTVAPNTNRIGSTFQSYARPISISSEYRTCRSTGALEKSFGELLRKRLGM